MIYPWENWQSLWPVVVEEDELGIREYKVFVPGPAEAEDAKILASLCAAITDGKEELNES